MKIHVTEISITKHSDDLVRIKFYGLPSEEGPELFLDPSLVSSLASQLGAFLAASEVKS